MCKFDICFWKHPILWIKQEMHLARMRYIAEQRFNDAAGTVACSIFSVKPGDVLAVMAPQTLCSEQREKLTNYLSSAMPNGVKTLILDGGATVSVISNAERSQRANDARLKVRDAISALGDALNSSGQNIEVSVHKIQWQGIEDESPRFIYEVKAETIEPITP